MDAGAFSFTSPFILLALGALPAIWWLLRVTPPAPQRERFFGLRFLRGLRSEEETPDKTPIWLLLLRLTVAALIVFGFAGPIFQKAQSTADSADVMVVIIDDDWAAAHLWEARRNTLRAVIGEALHEDIPVILAATSSPESEIKLQEPGEALARALALEPQPSKSSYVWLIKRLEPLLAGRRARTIWLSNGMADDKTAALMDIASRAGSLEIYTPDEADPALALAAPQAMASGFRTRIMRVSSGAQFTGNVQVFSEDGRFLNSTPFTLNRDARAVDIDIDLPAAVRNDAGYIAIDQRASAGAVALLDESAHRKPVGIVTGEKERGGQPLLSPSYYLERALTTIADARIGELSAHLDSGVSVMILADVGQLAGDEHDRLASWIEKGGVLIRFAGARTAETKDDLLPVVLRQSGTRDIGGAMSWDKPQGLAPFAPTSPFAGLPSGNAIEVRRQVLAEPSADLAEKTWASLADGTPLVTAARRGEGWIVLFHITANAEWSSLPLNGLFVSMLQRLVHLGRGLPEAERDASGETSLSPRLVLNGYGRLIKADASVRPIMHGTLTASADHPPGLYGQGSLTQAVNLMTADTTLEPLPTAPQGTMLHGYGEVNRVDFKAWLIGIALALLFFDAVASLLLRGYRFGLRHSIAGTTAALLFLCLTAPQPAHADPDIDFALKASLEIHLAYVTTGDAGTDQVSLNGLTGLSRVLNDRTSVPAAEPIGVDIEKDELAFFPVLYWPINADQTAISDAAVRRINAYMKNGGTIVFDTREEGDTGPGAAALEQILRRLDLPPLKRIPHDHVLRKAFYILNDFPGRNAGGDVWVEAARDPSEPVSEAQGDGVSSVVIGGGDWAAAWAIDEYYRPLQAIDGNDERQREYAFRFGVNLVMYALTGNYKADQVHVPALLERMGR